MGKDKGLIQGWQQRTSGINSLGKKAGSLLNLRLFLLYDEAFKDMTVSGTVQMCPNPCGFRHGHGPLDPAVWLSRLGFSHCSCLGCLLQTIPVCVKSCTNPLLKVVGKKQSLHAPVNNDVTAMWPPAGIVNKLMVWAGCGRASSRELVWDCAQGWRVSSQRPLHVAGGPTAIQGRSVETPRSWFMTIKCNLLLLHWCVLLGQHQAAACGSGVMLAPVESLCPWLPREMIPVQGHTGQEVALLFVMVPRVLLQPQPGLGYCAVSSDRRQCSASPA